MVSNENLIAAMWTLSPEANRKPTFFKATVEKVEKRIWKILFGYFFTLILLAFLSPHMTKFLLLLFRSIFFQEFFF